MCKKSARTYVEKDDIITTVPEKLFFKNMFQNIELTENNRIKEETSEN